jgi:hypothetical protein
MRFNDRAERLAWLGSAAEKLRQMEFDRKVAIMAEDYGKAYSLLHGINFARNEFRKVSATFKYASKKPKN